LLDAKVVISSVLAKRRVAFNVSNNLIETDIHIRSDAMQPDIAGNTSQPTRHPEIEVPGFALCDRGRRRHFFRNVVRLRSGEQNWRREEDRREKEFIKESIH